jgi:hypothetical protein
MNDWDNPIAKQLAREIKGKESALYVHGTCTNCGATVESRDKTQHNNWHATFIHRSEVKDGLIMSQVAWCDPGDHAFKKNSPGAQSLDIMQRDDEGEAERVTLDICGAHAFPTGTNNPTMRAVESAYKATKVDQGYTD